MNQNAKDNQKKAISQIKSIVLNDINPNFANLSDQIHHKNFKESNLQKGLILSIF